MKRFIPLLLGLTLVCFSFSNIDVIPETTTAEDCAVNVPIKICDFSDHVVLQNQGQCNPTSIGLHVHNDCTGTITAYLRVANLTSSPILGKSYTLPNGVPDLYYYFIYRNSAVAIGPINTFVYREDHGVHPIYEFAHNFTIDISPYCEEGPTKIEFDVSIKDQMGNDYPLQNHAHPDGIFYCDIFEESCAYCTYPPVGCPTSNGDLNFYNLQACGEQCPSTCPPPPPPPPSKLILPTSGLTSTQSDLASEEFTKADFKNTDPANLEVTITPNPFSDRLELNFGQQQNSAFTVEIMNSNGRLISKEYFRSNQDQSVYMDVNNLLSGLYYCKITVNNKVLIKKLVKL